MNGIVGKVAAVAAAVAGAAFGAAEEIKLPPEGVFIGSGVYPANNGLMGGGKYFTYWCAGRPTPSNVVETCAREGVGNTLQLWGGILDQEAEHARRLGLYVTCLAGWMPTNRIHKFVAESGDRWLGYDFGERYNFALGKDWGDGATLSNIADKYVKDVSDYCAMLKRRGWKTIMATSANFSLDWEVAGGVDVPCTEDYPFGDLTLSSSLGRGLYRQYGLKMWGSHLAHEWYSWIPHKNPHKMDTLRTAFQLKYMTGAKLIINESGNWQLQSSLCEDSPMSMMPILDYTAIPDALKGEKGGLSTEKKFEQSVIDEARKRFAYIDDRSPVAAKYRKIIRDFTAFCRENPCPKGQPEATWAFAKGNNDLGDSRYIAGYCIASAYDLVEKNPNWMHGHPEQSWDLIRRSLTPMPPMLAPNKNIHFAATPYGQGDVVSFARDNVTAEHLLKNYKAIMFSGWNTCSPKQYKTLCDYVKGGGKLVIGLCHLSTDDARNYVRTSADKLVNKGDFTELCGVKVTGKTHRKYWATGTSTEPNCLGFVSRRRFGYMGIPIGKLEYVAPKENFESLAVCDEGLDPFILRCKSGKGEVFLMNWWDYPVVANMDVGCSSEVADVGMVGYLYKYVARIAHGNVFISGPDFVNPDEDCNWIVYSYFPDAGKICLLNLDYDNERKFVLHWFGEKDFVTLDPGEFRLMDAPVLEPGEKLNVR
ncbi:MAG: hypothetical protein MJ138_02090 [Kiritimatiellae bacterium]|nr:hypothetical protein [Kiritimatiellia bacterium]